jgi:hypothetical protein
MYPLNGYVKLEGMFEKSPSLCFTPLTTERFRGKNKGSEISARHAEAYLRPQFPPLKHSLRHRINLLEQTVSSLFIYHSFESICCRSIRTLMPRFSEQRLGDRPHPPIETASASAIGQLTATSNRSSLGGLLEKSPHHLQHLSQDYIT